MTKEQTIELASQLLDGSIYYIKAKPLCEDAEVSAGAVRVRRNKGKLLVNHLEAKAVLERFRTDCRKFFPELEGGES